jgi:hypothetical protein
MSDMMANRLKKLSILAFLGLSVAAATMLLSRREFLSRTFGSSPLQAASKTSVEPGLNEIGKKQATTIAVNGTPPKSETLALQNFESRCAQPGVIVCQGFDTPSAFAQANWPGTGFYYKKDCPTWPTPCVQQDTSNSFSGASSARWDIYGKTGENAEANWLQNFPRTFGADSTFYVQYAFRADPNWVAFDWTNTGEPGKNTAPKLSIFHNHAATCAAEEITVHDHNAWATPTAYSDCGADQFTTTLDGKTYTSKGDFLLQQGFTEPAPFTGEKCQWAMDTPKGKCFKIAPNTWYTLYFKVHVGTWGQANSSLEAWFAPQGEGMKKFISVLSYTLRQDRGADGFDALTLTQFMTGKRASVDHPTAHVWYDELIVSAQPIAAPTGPNP